MSFKKYIQRAEAGMQKSKDKEVEAGKVLLTDMFNYLNKHPEILAASAENSESIHFAYDCDEIRLWHYDESGKFNVSTYYGSMKADLISLFGGLDLKDRFYAAQSECTYQRLQQNESYKSLKAYLGADGYSLGCKTNKIGDYQCITLHVYKRAI